MPIFTDTELVLRDSIADTAGLNLNDVWSVHTHIINGVTYVYVVGAADDGISVFSLASDGTLTFEYNRNDPIENSLNGASQMLFIDIGSNTYAYLSARLEDAIYVYSVGSDGGLTYVSAQTSASLELDGIAGKMSTVTIAGTTFLIASGAGDDGFNIFEAKADGTLVVTDSVSDTTNLNFIYDTATIEVGGSYFLYTASFFSDTISTYEIDAQGDATLIAHISNSANPDLDLDGVVGLTTATIDGRIAP